MWKLLTVVTLLLCITASAAFSTVYNETLARTLVKVNGAAYSSNAASCIKNIKEFSSDWHVVGTFTVPCSKIKKLQATCAVIVLKSDLEKQYIISFRGTVGNDQLLLQALGANPETFEKFGKVGSYVQSAFRGLWPAITPTIKNAKKEGYKIIVTGYSLGGALATVTALKVVADSYQSTENTYLLTFGSPRVGNSDFTASVRTNVKYTHRVVNKADTIPHLPPCVITLGEKTCHPSNILKLGYLHVQQEIWYNGGSDKPGATFVTTTRDEDPKGSNSLRPNYVLADHLAYFGLNLETYGSVNNCVS